MHKILINEAIIDLTIEADGPILIKAGASGADPTRPDMEFVRTHRNGTESVYLPGSSLKGVIRSHAERIARTVDKPLACDPLGKESCGERFNKKEKKDELKDRPDRGAKIYSQSCFICQMFGHTNLSSHIRIADAYPTNGVTLEERNGVAIDRVFGAVAFGPFQFEVATEGKFKTSIYVQNFTVAQLGLLALTLRDIQEQRVPIGFGKSRGLGKVKAEIGPVMVKYPTGGLMEPSRAIEDGKVYGAGSLVSSDEGYGFPEDDLAVVASLTYTDDGWYGRECELEGAQPGSVLRSLWMECVKKWAESVQGRRG